MNANAFAQKNYENISDWTLGENKPKQTQSPSAAPAGLIKFLLFFFLNLWGGYVDKNV